MKHNKTKTLSIKKLKHKVWKVFSLYIRLKDADALGYTHCYTCGVRIPAIETQEEKGAEAGHGLGGRNNSILFDEELVKPQCKRCNIFLGGNYDIFHAKLIKEHGLKWFENKLKLKNQSKQFTVEELNKLYVYYKAKVTKLLS